MIFFDYFELRNNYKRLLEIFEVIRPNLTEAERKFFTDKFPDIKPQQTSYIFDSDGNAIKFAKVMLKSDVYTDSYIKNYMNERGFNKSVSFYTNLRKEINK